MQGHTASLDERSPYFSSDNSMCVLFQPNIKYTVTSSPFSKGDKAYIHFLGSYNFVAVLTNTVALLKIQV